VDNFCLIPSFLQSSCVTCAANCGPRSEMIALGTPVLFQTVTILGPYLNFPLFSTIFISRSRSLVPHSFPHAPLGPSPNYLTSHLMNHLTNPQSNDDIPQSAVRSIMTCHHLTLFDLPAHDGLFLDCQLMMEPYLEPPRHDCTLVIFPYFFVTSVTRYFSNVYKRSYF